MHVLARNRIRILPQRRHIVQNPERPPVCRHHQVVILHAQIVYRRQRQIQLHAPPVFPIVERHKYPPLRTRIQQSLSLRILAHRPHKRSLRNPAPHAAPRRPVVGRLINVDAHVVILMPVHRHVRLPRIVRRRLNQTHAAELRQIPRCHIRPLLPFIPRDLHQPIVRPRPNQSLRHRRGRNRKHRVVVLRSRVVNRDRSARRPLLRLVIPR